MADEKNTQKSVAEQLWLHYYNNTLYKKGIITERERNMMRRKIDKRSSGRER